MKCYVLPPKHYHGWFSQKMKDKAQKYWPCGLKMRKCIISNIFFKKDGTKAEITIISKSTNYPTNRIIFDDLKYMGIVVKYCCPVYSDYTTFDNLAKITADKCMQNKKKLSDDFLII